MDDFDRQLLNRLQQRVPLVREPFAELAAEMDCAQQRLLDRLTALRADGVVREISAIFDAVALGYEQALVAMSVPPETLDRAGPIVAEHPGVSHCYGREGRVNLWLTLASSPNSRLHLVGTAELLAKMCGATQHMLLPTIRRYKLRVRFDMEGADGGQAGAAETAGGQDEPMGVTPAQAHAAPQLSDEQLRAIRALQIDLPARADPFAPVAAAEGLDPDMLLVHAADFLGAALMRRYTAVLHHRAAGAAANLLVAWEVSDAEADAAGARCAQSPNVSHCYLRPAGPDWPYTLYTMIHGRSREDCQLTVDEILTTTGLTEHAALWTTAEYKKQRVRLFAPAEADWEAANAP